MTPAVPEVLAGERLDRAVALLCNTSRARAAALVESGVVRVNGAVRTDRAGRLAAGDDLAVAPGHPNDATRATAPRPEPEVTVPVLYEDHHIVIVDKPAGLVVHPGAGRREGTMCGGLLARYPEMADVGDPARPGIVHRLDAGTSGLLVTARSPAAYDSLVAQLSGRTVRRCYEAICRGLVANDRGVIDAPVGRSGRRRVTMAVSERGRPARTAYEVLRRYSLPEPVTHLRCRLETGRTHQIRVHLEAIGHPLLGDEVYRGVGTPGGADHRVPGAPGRPALHAAELGFSHPDGRGEVLFESPLPPDLMGVLEFLS